MDPTRWKSIKETFSAVVDLPKPERNRILEEAEPELRVEIEKLLDSHEKAAGFIDRPALVEQGIAADEAYKAEDDLVGKTIGNYRILEKIGVGGMGKVYLAERLSSDFNQKVALKIIKRGMDSEAILKRFTTERKILSTLKHPNIAQLIDGGISPDGRPYFVMEYIEGLPLNEFCRVNNVSLGKRLEIFRLVCSAVEHAHANLIIHRDLKPSNILVTKDGIPKLLDFGIAKVLSDDGFDTKTATRAKMFTPEYASPEQILGGNVTTSTDVYSLGVVLYQLLTDNRPFNTKGKSFEQIVKSICETEPPRPSQTGENYPVTEEDKFRSVQIPRNQLRGDLDNIVLKAIRKEPVERYGSVQQLSEDVSRFLRGLPVLARPQTLGYRFEKYFKRHRIGVIAAGLVLLSLIGGISVATWQAIEARRARIKAEQRFNDVRRLTNSFLFEFHNAIQDLPGSTVARELVIQKALEYLDKLAKEEINDPSLNFELGSAYLKIGFIQGGSGVTALGKTDEALQSYQKSIVFLEAAEKSEPANINYKTSLATSYRQLAKIYDKKANYELTEVYHRKALDKFNEIAQIKPDDLATQTQIAESLTDVGDTIAYGGNLDEAAKSYERALEINNSILARDPANTEAQELLIYIYYSLGGNLGNPNFNNLGNSEEAIEIYQKSMAFCRERLKENDAQTYYQFYQALNLKEIGEVLAAKGDWKKALGYYKESESIQQKIVRADSENTRAKIYLAHLFTDIGEALIETGQIEADFAYHRQAIEILTKLAEKDKANTQITGFLARAHQRKGDGLVKLNKIDDALKSYKESLARNEEMTSQNRGNMEMQMPLALDHFKIGNAYFIQASSMPKSAAKRNEILKEAKKNFEQSRQIYSLIKSKNPSPVPPIENFIEKNTQMIAKCDAD